jgi:hypothetical protein
MIMKATATPPLADIAKITEGTITLGTGPAATAHPSYLVVAWGSAHEFAETGGMWVEVCGRCGGEGVTPFKWVHGGVCFGCNRTGLRPDIFSGTREERDAFVYAWARRKDRERRAAEKRAAKIAAEREAKWQAWATANADLVAWCGALTPDRTERILHDRCAIEDTREEAAACYGGEEVIDGPCRLADDSPEAGRWWARLGWYETWEDFGSYGHRVSGLIRDVRRAFDPLDAKSTAFLTAVMRRAVEAQQVSRYAGAEGEQVTVTGRVRVAMSVDGFRGRSQRMIILEGTGADAGVTLKTYTTAAAAWELEKGQEGVTITGTVSKLAERSGARETTVKRPRITVAAPVAEEAQEEAQEAPRAPQEAEERPAAQEAPQEAAEERQEAQEAEEAPAAPTTPRGLTIAEEYTETTQVIRDGARMVGMITGSPERGYLVEYWWPAIGADGQWYGPYEVEQYPQRCDGPKGYANALGWLEDCYSMRPTGRALGAPKLAR